MDVTKFARIAPLNELKKQNYFSRVARVQQSSHGRSSGGFTRCRKLRTKLSTVSVGNAFRSLSELVRCHPMFMLRLKFAVMRAEAPPRLGQTFR
jgi:hypothetical protein